MLVLPKLYRSRAFKRKMLQHPFGFIQLKIYSVRIVTVSSPVVLNRLSGSYIASIHLAVSSSFLLPLVMTNLPRSRPIPFVLVTLISPVGPASGGIRSYVSFMPVMLALSHVKYMPYRWSFPWPGRYSNPAGMLRCRLIPLHIIRE